MRFVRFGILALVLVGCGAAADGDDTTPSTQNPPTTNAGSVPERVKPVNAQPPNWFSNEDAAPKELIAAIATEIDAQYLGSMQVDWNNSGIGCTDGTTLQVITPGYLILFEHPDGLIRVHTDMRANWKVCDLARPLEGIPTVTS